jgi:hypothetical protein
VCDVTPSHVCSDSTAPAQQELEDWKRKCAQQECQIVAQEKIIHALSAKVAPGNGSPPSGNEYSAGGEPSRSESIAKQERNSIKEVDALK